MWYPYCWMGFRLKTTQARLVDYLEGCDEGPSANKPSVECELGDSVQLGHGVCCTVQPTSCSMGKL